MQHVIEKPVLLVPQSDLVVATVIHRMRDVDEVLPKLAGDILVRRIFFRELHRDREEIQRVHCHPTRAVRLSNVAASRQRRAAIENTDVVETEKAALKDVHPFSVFAIDPPREIQQQLLKHTSEKNGVADSTTLLLDLVDAPRGPRMYRWIHIAERPLVRGKLTVRVHVPLAQHQDELRFCELGINKRQWHAVKCKIPRRVPGILPLVGHRYDVGVVKMFPLVITSLHTFLRWLGRRRITIEPLLDYI